MKYINEKKSYVKRSFVLSLMMLLALTMCGCFQSKKAKEKVPADQSQEAVGTTEEKKVGITFPYEIEGGRLIVQSLFQASIDNPDCNNELKEDIASLEITNETDKMCTYLEVMVTMLDGRKIPFVAKDIPAGATIWAFATDNQSIEVEAKCEAIDSKAKYGSYQLKKDKVTYSVEETNVTVTNITDQDIKNLIVYCHCLFDETYFGGITYAYTIDTLPTGQSTVISADDCYLGTAEVVRIEEGN